MVNFSLILIKKAEALLVLLIIRQKAWSGCPRILYWWYDTPFRRFLYRSSRNRMRINI